MTGVTGDKGDIYVDLPILEIDSYQGCGSVVRELARMLCGCIARRGQSASACASSFGKR
jgi:hypothetical protein